MYWILIIFNNWKVVIKLSTSYFCITGHFWKIEKVEGNNTCRITHTFWKCKQTRKHLVSFPDCMDWLIQICMQHTNSKVIFINYVWKPIYITDDKCSSLRYIFNRLKTEGLKLHVTGHTQIDAYIPQKKKTTDNVVACLHCAINCEPSNLSEIFYILIIGWFLSKTVMHKP